MTHDRSIPWPRGGARRCSTATAPSARSWPRSAGASSTQPWIDAALRPGKSGGAFAHPTVPSAHPYLLLNYHGKTRDVMTLAHELGHGVHQVLAATQGYLLSGTPLTLAETASVFGEMLTFRGAARCRGRPRPPPAHAGRQGRGHAEHGGAADRLLPLRDPAARRAPPGRAEQPTGSPSSGCRCSTRASARPSTSPTDYGVYWAYIPHFIHSPFYVYAYAFGDCLVNALYGVYRDGAVPDFQQKYLDLLKAGGTLRHKELLAPFGLDASDPGFWQRGPRRDRRLHRRVGTGCLSAIPTARSSASFAGWRGPPAPWAASPPASPGNASSASRPTRRRMRRI